MIGAIIGDIIGSTRELGSGKNKEFELFPVNSRLTDDSLMTIAVAAACKDSDIKDEKDFKAGVTWWMRRIGRQYPNAGFGGMFFKWLQSDTMGPYNSFGNGSAMRVSPVALVAESLEEAERLAAWSAEVTHNHPNGVKGAKAVAAAIYLARTGADKEKIKKYIEEKYYTLNFTIDQIRPYYSFEVTCQGSVPQAIQCFLESKDFEDTIRLVVSLGGDCDTQGAMAGAIAEAFYGIPENLKIKATEFMDETVLHYYRKYLLPLY